MLYAASHLLQLVFNVSLQFLYASPSIALSLSKWLLPHSILRAGALLCWVLIEHVRPQRACVRVPCWTTSRDFWQWVCIINCHLLVIMFSHYYDVMYMYFSRGSCDAIFLRLLIRYRNPHRRMPQFEMLHGAYAESGGCSKRVSVCLPPLQQKIVAR